MYRYMCLKFNSVAKCSAPVMKRFYKITADHVISDDTQLAILHILIYTRITGSALAAFMYIVTIIHSW